MPYGSVRITSGGMIGTRRVDRWVERDAAVADGDRVGGLVAVADQGGDVLEVSRAGGAAEHDLDDGRVPDRRGCVVAPLLRACARD